MTNFSVWRRLVAKFCQPILLPIFWEGIKNILQAAERKRRFSTMGLFSGSTSRRNITCINETIYHCPNVFRLPPPLPPRYFELWESYCSESWKPHFWERKPSLVDWKRWPSWEYQMDTIIGQMDLSEIEISDFRAVKYLSLFWKMHQKIRPCRIPGCYFRMNIQDQS